MAVRPEKIDISKTRPSHVARNLFHGKVCEIGYLGSYTTYIVQADNGQRLKITEANTSHPASSGITWDDEVFFWWEGSASVELAS